MVHYLEAIIHESTSNDMTSDTLPNFTSTPLNIENDGNNFDLYTSIVRDDCIVMSHQNMHKCDASCFKYRSADQC